MLLNKRISIWYFIAQIKLEIIALALFSIFMGLLDLLPAFNWISLPLTASTILGTAVSLLLAFRISQSYERWWEARTIWGAIVNDSRTLIRQVMQFLPVGYEAEIKAFAERQIIWNYALGESLRKLPFTPPVQEYLDKHHIQATNIPNALLDEHANQVRRLAEEGVFTDFQQIQLSDMITRLCDSMGRCERIKNTVFPRSYTVLLHTLIYVFAAIFPFGLESSQLIVEVVISFAIPIGFIAIEKTAIIMQDPFENTPVDTPVTALARTIETNIRQMLGDKDFVLKPEPESYYLN